MLSSLLIIFQNYLILKEYKRYCSRIIHILIILSTKINTWFETRTFPSVRNLINWKLWKSSSTSDLQSFDRIVTVLTLRLSWRWELLEPEGFIVARIPLLSHKGSRNELQMCFLSVVAAEENKSHKLWSHANKQKYWMKDWFSSSPQFVLLEKYLQTTQLRIHLQVNKARVAWQRL